MIPLLARLIGPYLAWSGKNKNGRTVRGGEIGSYAALCAARRKEPVFPVSRTRSRAPLDLPATRDW